MQCCRIRHGHKVCEQWSCEGLHRSRNKTLWMLDMGHLALENKQLQDGLEQGSIDATVGEGNSQGEKADDKLWQSHSEDNPSSRNSKPQRQCHFCRKKSLISHSCTLVTGINEFKIWAPNLQYLRALMCLFVLAATAAEHNSRTSQLCHLTVREERKRKWLHFSSLSLLTMPAKWAVISYEILFPAKHTMPVRELTSLPGTVRCWSHSAKRDARQAQAVNPPVIEEPLWKAESVKGLISTDDAQKALRGSPFKKPDVFR